MKKPTMFTLPLVLFLFFVVLFTLCVCPQAGWTQELAAKPAIETQAPANEAKTDESATQEKSAEETTKSEAVSAEELENLKRQIEAERLKAELEKARAESERARADAEQSRSTARKAKKDKDENDCEDDEADKAEKLARDKEKAYRHDGFFLRMSFGFGVAGYDYTGKVEGPSPEIYSRNPSHFGPAVNGSLMLGGAVEDNLILHVDMWGMGHMFRENDERVEGFSLGVIGLGLTYYIMPANVYFTASLGPAASTLILVDMDREEGDGDVQYGIGTSLTVGKEWWVSENWGLGLALRGNYAYTENRDINGHQGGGFLLFSATYN